MSTIHANKQELKRPAGSGPGRTPHQSSGDSSKPPQRSQRTPRSHTTLPQHAFSAASLSAKAGEQSWMRSLRSSVDSGLGKAAGGPSTLGATHRTTAALAAQLNPTNPPTSNIAAPHLQPTTGTTSRPSGARSNNTISRAPGPTSKPAATPPLLAKPSAIPTQPGSATPTPGPRRKKNPNLTPLSNTLPAPAPLGSTTAATLPPATGRSLTASLPHSLASPHDSAAPPTLLLHNNNSTQHQRSRSDPGPQVDKTTHHLSSHPQEVVGPTQRLSGSCSSHTSGSNQLEWDSTAKPGGWLGTCKPQAQLGPCGAHLLPVTPAGSDGGSGAEVLVAREGRRSSKQRWWVVLLPNCMYPIQ